MCSSLFPAPRVNLRTIRLYMWSSLLLPRVKLELLKGLKKLSPPHFQLLQLQHASQSPTANNSFGLGTQLGNSECVCQCVV